jgi:sortase A
MASDEEVGRRRFSGFERLLILCGVACLAWCAYVFFNARRFQSRPVPAATTERAPTASVLPPPEAGPSTLPIGEPIGRIEVPRLHLAASMANGDDDGTLRVAVGHLPDTPFPWQNGNSALAGHRDTFFRELQRVRANDDLRVTTPYGDYTYRVTRTVIVTPEDLSVLDPTAEPTLTLITCYPFSYVGHAPKRFIVQAVRMPAPIS